MLILKNKKLLFYYISKQRTQTISTIFLNMQKTACCFTFLAFIAFGFESVK
jgi:hypothetical protein